MKQEKTAEQWFDMLIEPYCSQAKENSSIQELRQFQPSLHCAIGSTFTWSETKQGQEYWDDVYESTRKEETTYLKPTEPVQEEHECKYCKAMVTQPDDQCYLAPKQPQFWEWAKVEDGLPELGKQVLIFTDKGWMEVAERIKVGEQEIWEGSIFESSVLKQSEITHWTCLPPNPKD